MSAAADKKKDVGKAEAATAPAGAGTGGVGGNKKEPSSDRVMKDVVAPPAFPLTRDQLFDKKGMPILPVLKEHLQKEGRLTQDAAMKLIDMASALFKAEPNMLELRYPITVCGDVHGQFFDLMRLFDVGGDPRDTQYLFLGDYVDRGCFSTEVVYYLYALKITYPKSFYMLRGNHECRQLTAFFNFKDECTYKYNISIYDSIMASFDQLPIAAIINKTFFCVHGGLSPDVTTLEDVKSIDRFQEIPREGPMCDLLWSDPYEEGNESNIEHQAEAAANKTTTPAATNANTAADTAWFGYNETRQCSYVFGVDAVKQFLTDNKLTSIIRAHEAQVDGYKMHMVNKSSGIPRVITIFSAPNYCDVYKNKAACLKFDHNVLNIKQFVDSPHPYYLPNFMDVFQWSLPFVAEKVTDMLASVLHSEDSGSDGDEPEAAGKGGSAAGGSGSGSGTGTGPNAAVVGKWKQAAKSVMPVSRLLRMYKILRQENEAIVQLKQLTPNHKVPFGLLRKGPNAIKEAVTNFYTAQKADKENEKRPDYDANGKKIPPSAHPLAHNKPASPKGAGAGSATSSGTASGGTTSAATATGAGASGAGAASGTAGGAGGAATAGSAASSADKSKGVTAATAKPTTATTAAATKKPTK